MDKSSTSPSVRLPNVLGYKERNNDVVFCGSEGQQHVVFFPGDVQVRPTIFLLNRLNSAWKRFQCCSKVLCFKIVLIGLPSVYYTRSLTCFIGRACHGNVNIRVCFVLFRGSLFCVPSSSKITLVAIRPYKLLLPEN